ncbi:hypothetical protein F4X86_04255 [Candidatus Saccharibacteria bacterium]|nr:hypothetical protein [Candidatus Saccharibacteria bacterium]
MNNHDNVDLPTPYTSGQKEKALKPHLPRPLAAMGADAEILRGFMEAELEPSVQVRFEVRSRRVECMSHSIDGGTWEQFTDRQNASLLSAVRCSASQPVKRYKLGRPPEWTEARFNSEMLAVLAHREVDGFNEWVRCRPEWDGIERVSTLLVDYLEAEDDELCRWAARYPFIGALQRSHKPGAKIDQTPVLVGPQGGGKSAFLRCLMPAGRWSWFTDSLRLDLRLKEWAEATAGVVLAEIPELAGRSKADLAELKALLTRQDDGGIRLAYGRHTESLPRRWIGVATTNDTDLGILPDDPSGNRRWVVVPVGEATQAIETSIVPLLDQLWAEAVSRYCAGEWTDAGLPRELLAEAEARAQEFTRVDEVISNRVAKLPEVKPPGWTIEQLAAEIGMNKDQGLLDRSAQMRLGRVLRAQGWLRLRRQVENKQAWRWISPEHWASDSKVLSPSEEF